MKLPDYKNIAKKNKIKETEVSKEEVDSALKWIQKSRAKFTIKNGSAQKGDFVEIEYYLPEEKKPRKDAFVLGEGRFVSGFEEKIVGLKAGQEKENLNLPRCKKIKIISVQSMELPELTDDFASGIGDFKNLDEMKEKLKESLGVEKQQMAKQKRRIEILTEIVKEAELEIPSALIEKEKEHILENLKKSSPGIKISEELLDSLKKEAEKRLKSLLVLNEIGKRENINISEKEVEEESREILKRFPGVKEKSSEQELDLKKLREYTKEVLKSEKIFQMLEAL